jgi:antitoxin component YwqK of YwqJK toxin-antitoxin module
MQKRAVPYLSFILVCYLFSIQSTYSQLISDLRVNFTIDSMSKTGYEVCISFDGVGRKKDVYFTNRHGIKEGPVFWYYPNGHLKATCIFKKDKLNGMYQVYDYEGNVLIRYTYLDGMQHGKYEHFFQDGKRAIEGNFNKGLKEGEFKEYHYGLGTVRAVWNATKDKREGAGIWYHPNNQVYFTCNFYADMLDGEYLTYDTLGKLTSKQYYKNDVLEGELIRYYTDGQIAAIGKYKAGRLNGTFKRFYSNGKVLSETNFSKGKKNGVMKRYYPSGEIEMVCEYDDDLLKGQIKIFDIDGKLKEGNHKYFYPNGLVHVSGYCVNGRPEGILEAYDENGIILSRLKCKNGMLHDISQYFNSQGKPYRIEFYENGDFVKLEEIGN